MGYYTWKSYKLSLSPLALFEKLSQERGCFFLDSCLRPSASGRYSLLGIEPFADFSAKGVNPFPRLRKIFRKFETNTEGKMPFLGGGVGYLAYDLGFCLEDKVKALPKLGFADIPDVYFAFYNTAVVIDHLKKKLHICAVGAPESTSRAAKALCADNIRKIERLLGQEKKIPRRARPANAECGKIKASLSREEYLRAVAKAKEYIRKGDIYQVNLSQRFHCRSNLPAVEIYLRLREASPANFSAFLDCPGHQVISSSPERFLQYQNGLVATQPMKGTRQRGLDPAQDRCLSRELLNSPKDKAELMMIVDLLRNDLGRVCSYQSIKVEQLRRLERYKTVFQTTATVTGRLYPGKDRFDLLRACFPGGSITGCPKIRSMQIIEQLEPDRRGIYTGALGYLSFCGNMDLNILIRSLLKKGEDLYFGSGGGIVADSDPGKEYEESLIKARGILEALRCVKLA